MSEADLAAGLRRAVLTLYGAVGASRFEFTVIVKESYQNLFILRTDPSHVADLAAAVQYFFASERRELPILIGISGTIRAAIERLSIDAENKNSKSPSRSAAREF